MTPIGFAEGNLKLRRDGCGALLPTIHKNSAHSNGRLRGFEWAEPICLSSLKSP